MKNGRGTATGPANSVAIALICIFGGPPTEMAAQEPLQIGDRVRVTAPGCGLYGSKMSYQALRSDTLFLDTTACPLASVARLDVRRGRDRNLAAGFLIGGIVGLIGGYAYCNGCKLFDRDLTTEMTLLGGAVGAAVGLIAGAFTRTDRWEEVPLERLYVSVVPQRDGRFGLGFSVRF